VYIGIEAVGIENQPIGEHDQGLSIEIRAESNLPSVNAEARSKSICIPPRGANTLCTRT